MAGTDVQRGYTAYTDDEKRMCGLLIRTTAAKDLGVLN